MERQSMSKQSEAKALELPSPVAIRPNVLLPCPFCGADARYVNTVDGGCCVECTEYPCMASSKVIHPDKADPMPLLAESWNARDGELAAIGARWKLNSSLEEWFPITAEELEKCTNRIIALELENALLRKANQTSAGPGKDNQ